MLRTHSMRMIPILPSLLTLGNATCGFLAIAYTADGLLRGWGSGNQAALVYDRLLVGAWLILLGMVFDALDGKVARLTRRTSDFGGQLDSLCDAITFGVAPAFLAKVLIEFEAVSHGYKNHPRLFFWAAAIFALCAVLRLARFNAENEHSEDAHRYFRGLPTPAAAGFIATTILFFLSTSESKIAQWLIGDNTEFMSLFLHYALPLSLVGLGILMVSRITYVHLFNYLLRGKKTFASLIQIVFFVAVAMVEYRAALILLFYFYAFSGPVLWLRRKFWHRSKIAENQSSTVI